MYRRSRFTNSSSSFSKGFSIVELMVAILIGLIILSGVVQVVMTSRTTFFAQEDMSYIQENARYALDILGKDIQSSGYWGCAGAGATMALVGKIDSTGYSSLMGVEPFVGFEGETAASLALYPAAYLSSIRALSYSKAKNAEGTAASIDNPDSIITRRFSGTPVSITSHNNQTRTINFESGGNVFKEGEYIAIVAEDCQRVGVIRAATASGNAITYSSSTVCGTKIKPNLHQKVTCPAATDSLIEAYLPGSVAMNYVAHAYYVGKSSAYSGASEQPALKRIKLRHVSDTESGIEEEIALGVEDLEILYGVSTGTQIDRFLKASELSAADWSRVAAVQVSLLFRAQTQSAPTVKTETFLGNSYTDRYMRQVVTATYRVRNRI